jgi:hypothetical protein
LSPDLPARYLAPALSFSARHLALCFVEKVRDSGPSLFVCYPTPSTCVRTKTSCARDPNSILVFFLSDLSLFLLYLTCPSFSFESGGPVVWTFRQSIFRSRDKLPQRQEAQLSSDAGYPSVGGPLSRKRQRGHLFS